MKESPIAHNTDLVLNLFYYCKYNTSLMYEMTFNLYLIR